MNYSSLKSFPKDFFWSASTSAYQFEGAYLEDGKKLSIVDKNINSDYADTSITSDHYHRYKRDISLMKELGLNSYRFSISWPRVLPDGRGEINKKGLDFYKELVKELKKNDIEPLATIYHFDLPLALQEEYGGWSSRKVINDFENYCKVLFENLGKYIKYWFTINEQSNMFLLPYLLEFNDDIPIEKQKYEMNHIMSLANAKAIKLARKMISGVKIGPAIGVSPNYPLTASPKDVQAAREADDLRTYFFTDLYVYGEYKENVWNYIKGRGIAPTIHKGDMEILKSAKPDFLGINYYQSKTVEYAEKELKDKQIKVNSAGNKGESSFEIVPGIYKGVSNPYVDKTEWDWEVDPIGLRNVLNNLYDRYKMPMIITENGIGAVEELDENEEIVDQYRIDYLENHLRQCKLAITDGVNLIGFSPWSFMDLLSTTSGFRKRYGFVYVNRSDDEIKDLKRIKKKSFYWYQNVIKNNASKI